jgi:hypothetical protein
MYGFPPASDSFVLCGWMDRCGYNNNMLIEWSSGRQVDGKNAFKRF